MIVSNPSGMPRAFGRRIDTHSPIPASPLFQAWLPRQKANSLARAEGSRAPVSVPSGGFESFHTGCDHTVLAINQTQQLCLLLSYKTTLKGGAQAAPEDVGQGWPANSCTLTSASPAGTYETEGKYLNFLKKSPAQRNI